MGRKNKNRRRKKSGGSGTTRSGAHSTQEEHGAARPPLDSPQRLPEDSLQDIDDFPTRIISIEGGVKELHFHDKVHTVQLGDTHNHLPSSRAEATGDGDDEREMHVLAEFEPTLSGPDEVNSTIRQLVQQVVGDYHNVSQWHSNKNLCLRLASLFEEQGASLCRVQFSSIHFYVLTKTRANYKRLKRACSDGTLSTALTELLVTPALEDAAGVELRVRTHLQESSMLSDIPQTTDVQEKKVRSLHGMSSNDVADWLVHEVDIPVEVAARFKQEDVDGALLAEYKEKHIKKDFNLTTGIWRKIKYAREKLLGVTSSDSSSSESGGEESNKPIKRLVEERASLAEGDFDHSSREAASSSSMSKGSEMGQLQRGQLRFDGETDANHPQRSASIQQTLSKEELSAEEERVRYLLTGDESGTLDIAFHPLLVVNKPQISSSDDHDLTSLYERFGFTSLVNWNAVLDCDSESPDNGLCAMVQQKRELKLLSPSTFRAELSLEEVEFNDVPAWIFANGREDSDDIPNPCLTSQWNEKYGADVYRAIDFFTTSVIPKDRAVVIFILLSDTNMQIMSDIFMKLQSSMQGQGAFTFLVDNVELYEQWVQEVKKWLPKEQLDERSLIGADWRRIDGHIRKLLGKTPTEPGKLPLSQGQNCIVPERERSKWQNIEVLLQNECENPAMDENSPEFQEFVSLEEHKFYQGNAVSWWNFFLTDERDEQQGYNHVFQRDASRLLQSKVEAKLENMKNVSDPLVTISLFYEPGSGASTAARQVLWNFRRQIRCVVVRRAILPTADELRQVRSLGYGDGEDVPPVLVLLDDMDDDDVIDFIAYLKDVYQDEVYLTFILLQCRRTSNPEAMAYRNGENSVVMKHKLSDHEHRWFDNKCHEYEEKYKAIPERLIGFMLMKEECNPDYIRKVVLNLLQEISGKEAELLKYISVISKFMENFGMPVSCCDEFMKAHSPQKTQGEFVLWENRLSNATRLLLVFDTHHTKQGPTKVVKLTSPCLAAEIVKQLVESKDGKIGNVVSEFIHESGILDKSDYMKSYIARKTHELLVSRRKTHDNDSKKQPQFSPLITHILKDDKSMAIRLLQEALEKFQKNGFIAQQLARLHLAEKNFDEAKCAANIAIDFQEWNCFFWHTLGMIVCKEMTTYGQTSDTLPNKQSNKQLFYLLQEGMNAFQKCQHYCKTAKTTFSISSGYIGELEVIFLFLEVFEQRNRLFHSLNATDARDVTRCYLLTNDKIPTLADFWIAFREQLKELKERAIMSFEKLDDLLTCSDIGSSAMQEVENKAHDETSKLLALHKKLVWFFSVNDEENPPDSVKNNPEAMCEWRRSCVKSMGADRFTSIFKLAQNNDEAQLTTVLQLLDQNRPKTVFDLRLLVCVHFALFSIGKRQTDFDRVSQMIRELNESDCSLYGALFALLLAWSTESVHASQRRGLGLSIEKAVKNLRAKWHNLTDQNSTQRREGIDRSLPRHQLGRRKPATHFLLAKGNGFERFVHIYMFRVHPSKLDEERSRFWSQKEVVEKLARLEGTIQDAKSLVYKTPDNERVNIRMSRQLRIQPSQEKVTFFLGFSFAGLVAYDVTTKRKEPSLHQLRDTAIPQYILGQEYYPDE